MEETSGKIDTQKDDATVDIDVKIPEPEAEADGVYEAKSDTYRTLTTIKNGKKNGLMQVFEGKHLTMDLYFEDDVLQGPLNLYYPNQKIQSRGQYLNGVLQGEFLVFYANGSIQMKMNYHDGKQNGKTMVYAENGELAQESFYTDGILNGEVVTYHDGDVLTRQFYVNGVEEKDSLLQRVA